MARALTLFFLLLAIAAATYDGLRFYGSGTFELSKTGDIWYQVSPAGLNTTQAAIERHLWPPLWDPVLLTILNWPAVFTGLVFALPFGVTWFVRARRRRRMMFAPRP